jgi:aspartyl-tRNA(Asn)/glutamyl-tRNA(Gln) amidotransferase subunit B
MQDQNITTSENTTVNKKYAVVIGLEIHVQLNTRSKLMCSCANEYNPENPNKNICPFCTGQPGALPVLNQEAVKKAILFGQAVGATIPQKTRWDRKNYFYPDLPTGYQISQYDNPIVEGGSLQFYIEDKQTGSFKESSVDLTRAHLETDAAKLLHLGGKTMVDFNRSGCPLIEIVTEPCITSPAQAMAFVTELQLLARTLGISEADMDKGQMRFDCNVSLRNPEEQISGALPKYRTETKNINSTRALGRAIEYEMQRQETLLDSGIIPVQETRGWRDDLNKSFSQRSKEDAMDYRYFPEPDLQILEIKNSDLLTYNKVPKIPHFIRKSYVDKGLSVQIANIFLDNKSIRGDFDILLTTLELEDNQELLQKIKPLANLLTGFILPELNKRDYSDTEDLMSHQQILDLLEMVISDKIANQNLNKLLALLPTTKTIEDLATQNSLVTLSDSGMLVTITKEVIVENDTQVVAYKAGKEQVLGFLVGQCMKKSKGQGNPQKFNELLKAELSN